MDENETGKEIPLSRLLLIIAAVLLSGPLFFGAAKSAKTFGQRKARADFEKAYPSANILETQYTGFLLKPDTVTFYAYDTEYKFTFVTEYERQDGELVRKEMNDGCFMERVGMRRDLVAVTEVIPQYLKTPYLVLFYPENSPGFFLVTQEKDHDTLLSVYQALRTEMEKRGNGMSFNIAIPEEDIYAKLEATDYGAVLCEDRYYRKPWNGFGVCGYPVLSIAAQTLNCQSLFIHYVTDTEKYFAVMDEACAENKSRLQARELCYEPGREEIIMAVYVNG